MNIVRVLTAAGVAALLSLTSVAPASAGEPYVSETVEQESLTPEQQEAIAAAKARYQRIAASAATTRKNTIRTAKIARDTELVAINKQISDTLQQIKIVEADGGDTAVLKEKLAELSKAARAAKREYNQIKQSATNEYITVVKAAKARMKAEIRQIKKGDVVTGQARLPITVWQDCPTDPALDEFVTGKFEGKSAYSLCVKAVRKARTVEAGAALVSAFWSLGEPLALTGEGREDTAYDAGSLVSRSFAYAGLSAFQPGGQSLTSAQILGRSGYALPDFMDKMKKGKPGDIVGLEIKKSKLVSASISIGGGAVISAAGLCGSEFVCVADNPKPNKKQARKLGPYAVIPALATS